MQDLSCKEKGDYATVIEGYNLSSKTVSMILEWEVVTPNVRTTVYPNLTVQTQRMHVEPSISSTRIAIRLSPSSPFLSTTFSWNLRFTPCSPRLELTRFSFSVTRYRWVVVRVSLARSDATYETAAPAVIRQEVVSITSVSCWGGPSMVGLVGIESEVGESGVENTRSTSHAVKRSLCISEEWKRHSKMMLIVPRVSRTTSTRTSSSPRMRRLCGRTKISSAFLVELRSIVGPWTTGLLIEGCKDIVTDVRTMRYGARELFIVPSFGTEDVLKGLEGRESCCEGRVLVFVRYLDRLIAREMEKKEEKVGSVLMVR